MGNGVFSPVPWGSGVLLRVVLNTVESVPGTGVPIAGGGLYIIIGGVVHC